MLNILLLVSISRVLSYIDPCLPKGRPCKRYQDCPKDWACIDDSPDPIDPNNVHGICVGNKRIPGCISIIEPWGCPMQRPNLNTYCGSEHEGLKCKYGNKILTCNGGRWKDSSRPNPNHWMCPKRKPNSKTYCGLEHKGLKCKYGNQIFTCDDGKAWKDSSGPNPNPGMCPKKRPNFNDYCHSSHEGLKCKYGKQLCCEKELPEVVLTCTKGSWMGSYVDTTCMFEHECCNVRLTDKNIARCKQAICYQGIKCSCDSFPSVKRALCYP